MKNMKLFLIVFLLNGFGIAKGAPLALTAPAVETQALIGLRNADFNAAPGAQSMYLYEANLSAGVAPFPEIPVFIRGVLDFSTMRGTLDPGLTSFSGASLGPEVAASWQFASFRPFAKLGYSWGRYQGKGAESWDGTNLPSLYLTRGESLSETPRNFRSNGYHVGAGTAWDLSAQAALVMELSAGFETLETSGRIVFREQAFERDSTAFNSRALLFGAQMAL